MASCLAIETEEGRGGGRETFRVFVFPSHSCTCWGLAFQAVTRHQFLLLLCSCPSFACSINCLFLCQQAPFLLLYWFFLWAHCGWVSGCGLSCQREPTHHMKCFVGSPLGCASFYRFTTSPYLVLLLVWLEVAPLSWCTVLGIPKQSSLFRSYAVQECLALFCCFLCCSSVSIQFTYQMAKAVATSGLPAGSHPFSVSKIDAKKEDTDVHLSVAYVMLSTFQMHNYAI